ncbi:MAG: PEGA domain-containing protein [Myxococcales bacterium]|nr:PEGA domain-containing protein [Myxococcales bacterium]
MRFLLVFTAASLCVATSAFAQSSDWLVLPVIVDDDDSWSDPARAKVSRSLSERGVGVWSSGQAATRFEERGSAPSAEVTDSDIEEWVTRSREAIRHLARGDYDRALQELKRAQVLSRKAADELNREKTRSQNVLDTCLYMVRALLETGNRSRAKAQVQECVQLVPRGEPNEHMHPPNIIRLYQDAALPDPQQTGSLVVDSEPSACDVRINGVRFGQTPFEMSNIYRGTYRVQVECDPSRRGRVHPVEVGTGKSRVFVDVRFDRAVQTEPSLRLQYSARPNQRVLVEDAQQIAKVLPAAAVVTISSVGIDVMELRVISGTQRRVGVARIPSGPTGPRAADVSNAVEALLAGECKDFTGPKPVPMGCEGADARSGRREASVPAAAAASTAATAEAAPARRPPRGQFITGVTLASVGAASLITGYALLAARGETGGDQGWVGALKIPDLEQAKGFQDQWINLGRVVYGTAAFGSAALIAAMPLVLPYQKKTPWWAWLSGGLGVGALVASVTVGVTAPSTGGVDCASLVTNFVDAQACVDHGQRVGAAVLLGTSAAPLITMPLVYLFRKSDKRLGLELSPTVHASRTGGSFGVQGTF